MSKEEAKILLIDDDEDIFVHFSNILMEGYKKLDQGDQVKFEINQVAGKGPEAVNVELLTKDSRFKY